MFQWLSYALIGSLTASLVSRVILAWWWPGAWDVWPHIIRAVLLCLACSTLVAALAGLVPARNPLDALKDR